MDDYTNYGVYESISRENLYSLKSSCCRSFKESPSDVSIMSIKLLNKIYRTIKTIMMEENGHRLDYLAQELGNWSKLGSSKVIRKIVSDAEKNGYFVDYEFKDGLYEIHIVW